MQSSGGGIWHAIKPRGLSRRSAKHNWHFANYIEPPSDRQDDQWYSAFLIRDEDFKVFGIREFLGDLPHHDMRDFATKVLQDQDLMKELITDDPDVRSIWKGR